MYKDEIKVLKSEKREAIRIVLKEFLSIYLKLKFCFPDLKEERNKLVMLFNQFLELDRNEKEVLNIINKDFGNSEYNQVIDKLLNEFDQIFDNYYKYLEKCFEGYEEVLGFGDIIDIIFKKIDSNTLEDTKKLKYRMIIPPINFQIFDNNYKNKVKKIVRSI